MRSPIPALGERPDPGGRLRLSARPALRVTLAGAALLLTGLAAAGPTLAVPGAALVLLGVLAPAWVLALGAGIRLGGQPLEETVTEGRQISVEVTVGGRRLLGLSGAKLVHPLLDAPLALSDAISASPNARGRWIGRRGRTPDRFRLVTEARGRGRLSIAPPSLELSDPLGLARAGRTGAGPGGELLVLPRTEPVHWLDLDLRDGTEQSQLGRAALQGIDIAGLRDYQVGTPATRIHWPTLARGGPLIERVFAAEARLAPLIAVDPRVAGPGVDPALLDAAIRAAASLTLALAETGPVELLLPGRSMPMTITTSLTAWPAAHRALALIEPAARSAAPPRITAAGAGTLFYVCTDPTLARAAHHRWGGEMLTVMPRLPGAVLATAALEVAGCVALATRDGG